MIIRLQLYSILVFGIALAQTEALAQLLPGIDPGPQQLLKAPAKPDEIIEKLGELGLDDAGRAQFTFAYLQQLGLELEEPEELAAIGRFLKSEDAKTRAGAARLLLENPPAEFVPDLKKAAEDLEPDEQATLGVSLSDQHGDTELLERLVARVTDEEIPLEKRRELALQLLPLAPKALAPAYVEMLRSPEEPVRYVAWKRLTQLAGTEMGRAYQAWAGWLEDQLARVDEAGKLPCEEDADFEPGDGGIGIYIREAGKSLIVYGVGPGSPADKIGLEPGDYIDAVNGMPVAIRTLSEVVTFEFRGEPDTPVMVTYRKPGQPITTIKVLREEIKVAMAQGGQVRFGQFVEAPDVLLPKEQNEATMQGYIDEVLTGGNGGIALDGQRMLMLRKVGPDYVHLLLNAMEAEERRAGIANVIEMIVDDSHREMIVHSLEEYPELIDVIHDRGWSVYAKEQLLDGLAKELEEPEPYLPTDWINAVVQLQTPESFPLLIEYLRRGRYPAVTYQAIRNLPGIDLRDAVAEMWTVASWRREIAGDTDTWFNTSFFSVRDAAQIAVEYGHIGALELCISRLGRREWTSRGTWEEIVREHIDFVGTAAETEAWFLANRDQLEFDPASRKYLVSKPKS